MNNNISVIIITLNEEKHIARCINSILPVTKNIYIVDSFSSDNTKNIAESLGANVHQNKWPGSHAKQFQWGINNCNINTKWVMKMDADEIILPDLASEINFRLDSLNDDISGIYIKRRVKFMDKWIRFGGYYPIWLLRIWKTNAGFMEQRWMDEHIKLKYGKAIKFNNDILDHNLNNLTWWVEKHNNYSSKEAADILNTIYLFTKNNEIAPNLFGRQEQRKRALKNIYAHMPLFLRPILYFIWRYFFRLGFLDGRTGLIWHFLQGFWYRFLVDSKIKDIYQKTGKDKNKIYDLLEDEYDIKL
jgi:glycosyltransferase involved in cell wall biosynthesis